MRITRRDLQPWIEVYATQEFGYGPWTKRELLQCIDRISHPEFELLGMDITAQHEEEVLRTLKEENPILTPFFILLACKNMVDAIVFMLFKFWEQSTDVMKNSRIFKESLRFAADSLWVRGKISHIRDFLSFSPKIMWSKYTTLEKYNVVKSVISEVTWEHTVGIISDAAINAPCKILFALIEDFPEYHADCIIFDMLCTYKVFDKKKDIVKTLISTISIKDLIQVLARCSYTTKIYKEIIPLLSKNVTLKLEKVLKRNKRNVETKRINLILSFLK